MFVPVLDVSNELNGVASPVLHRRNDSPWRHHRVGVKNDSVPDSRPLHYHRVVPHEHIFAQLTRVQGAPRLDVAMLPNAQPGWQSVGEIGGSVEHWILADVDFLVQQNSIQISPDHNVVPDSVAGAHINLSHNGGAWCNEVGVSHLEHSQIIQAIDCSMLGDLLRILLDVCDVCCLCSCFSYGLDWLLGAEREFRQRGQTSP